MKLKKALLVILLLSLVYTSPLSTTLQAKGLLIKQVRGDGNCMFRAISDQLYGTEDFHSQLRKYALELVIVQADFYQNFVENNDINQYVTSQLPDGVPGDHIELQALRTLLDIPIEIYLDNGELMKTGMEEQSEPKQEPIRLAFQNQNHYNSIKPISSPNRGLIQELPGVIEEAALLKLKKKNNN